MRFCLICLLVLCPVAAAAASVHDTRYKFDAQVPAGFEPWPADLPRISGNTLQAFYKGDLTDNEPDRVIAFQHLGGVIGREHLDPAALPGVPPGARIEIERIKWRSFELDLLVMYMTANGFDIVSVGVQVPLKPEAIQINVAGPAGAEAEVRGYLSFVLDSMEGESNWLSTNERIGRLVGGVGGFVVVVVAVAVVIVVSRRKNKSAPPPMYPQTYMGMPAQAPPMQPPPPQYEQRPNPNRPPWGQ